MGETFIVGLVQHPWLFLLLLFGSLTLAVEFGAFLARSRAASEPSSGVPALDGAVFALLGLLVAFSFSAAADRFSSRRDLIVAEANAIGTAALRIDLMPEDAQPQMRDTMKRYIASRVSTFEKPINETQYRKALAASHVLQNELWAMAVAASRRPDAPNSLPMLLLPALNEMIDITTTRTYMLIAHTPPLIYIVLWGAALVAAILAGTALKRRNRHDFVHIAGFAGVISIALYVIVDFDHPRLGLIRINSYDLALRELE
jgi:hypothetical protein